MKKTLNTAAAALALASFVPASQPRPLADSPICITSGRECVSDAFTQQRLALRGGLKQAAKENGWLLSSDELDDVWREVFLATMVSSDSDIAEQAKECWGLVRAKIRLWNDWLSDPDPERRRFGYYKLPRNGQQALECLLSSAKPIDSDNFRFIAAEAIRSTGVSKATAYRMLPALEKLQRELAEANSGAPEPLPYRKPLRLETGT